MTNPINEEHTGRHWVSIDDQAHFGTYPCDCCGSRLAGDRWDALLMGWSVQRDRLEEINAGTICVDCLMNT